MATNPTLWEIVFIMKIAVDNSPLFLINNVRSKGFTLIELLIALSIIAILAAIAYPSYQAHVNKGRRAEAKSSLMEAAQWMERFYTEHGRYDLSHTEQAVKLPESLQRSPKEGRKYYYTIGLDKVTATEFVLKATPVQSHQDDLCGALSLTQNGMKGANNRASSRAAECW